jgi:hypothetical protein
MNALGFLRLGEKSLKLSTLSMKRRVKDEQPLKLNIFGPISLIARLKLEILTCSTKIMQIENPISRILEQSRAQISAAKLWNILPKKK